MKIKTENNNIKNSAGHIDELPGQVNEVSAGKKPNSRKNRFNHDKPGGLSEILFITSYPPRECGIATYSNDLIKSINNKFSNSLSVKVCALESGKENYAYPKEVKYTLKTSEAIEYEKLGKNINNDDAVKIVLVQHEFGLFKAQELAFLNLLVNLSKPLVIVFHTVLPDPDAALKLLVESIAAACRSIIVMTNNSAEILVKHYGLPNEKVTCISHGTHLVQHLSKDILKEKYGLSNRRVLSTFGLLSSGKGIETTLEALPIIVKTNPEVVFLIIGKTHPEVVKNEGEEYRQSLESLVILNKLSNHVIFVNRFLPLTELLEYLQLTDVYLFTANNPNQAVSGTFVYAMSCACPIISTPIPHAKEVLSDDLGIIFDFSNYRQLADGVNRLLNDESLRTNISSNTLQKIVSTAWENSAVSHALLFRKLGGDEIKIQYNLPPVNLSHIERLTTNTGIIQFSRISQPDLNSGYTLDDNARAMIAMCLHYNLKQNKKILAYIHNYLRFIKLCQQPEGNFLNYVDADKNFTDQNHTTNLEDSNGRAIWALGFLISLKEILPEKTVASALALIQKTLPRIEAMHSTRAMAFAIKGLCYYNSTVKSEEAVSIINTLAKRLVQMYKHESTGEWEWFEDYLTYANSILPEAMLYTWQLTGEQIYKDIAKSSLNFLVTQTFNENGIEVISNKRWLKRGEVPGHFGEQPIDVAYTIIALSKFYEVFGDKDYYDKMIIAFNWFLGNNRLHQIIYNPCTGGCYDGLEETHVNLNQGAESTVSYLMARLTVEKYLSPLLKPAPVNVKPVRKKSKLSDILATV
jgi:glycosyltransferase involved in cell wall biosynthesis